MVKRSINLFIALFAIAIIAMETYIYWHTKFRPWQPSSSIGRLIYYYSFFTVLSNLMLALSCLWLSVNPNCNRYSFKVIRLNGLAGVIITAIVYNLVLRGIHTPPNALMKITNESLHAVIPALGLLSWLIWGPFRRINVHVIIGSILSMLAYGIYIFVRGYYTNQYPYPFINVVRIGYPKALYASSIVFLLFFGVVFLLWAVERLRKRKMKLYIYEHCPFCVRARMIFGLKNIPVEKQVLLSDDFQSPERMIGEKMVPILQKDDGSYMPESLDIVDYVDNNYGDKPILTGPRSSDITDLIKQLQQYDYKLVCPRYIKLGLAEFATQSAIDSFVNSKSKKMGSFDECLMQTDSLVSAVSAILNKLELLIVSPDACNGQLSLDDICLFPVLRNLTCVKSLTFSSKIKDYLQSMAKLSKVDLFFDKAI